jgi:hypothetical protein
VLSFPPNHRICLLCHLSNKPPPVPSYDTTRGFSTLPRAFTCSISFPWVPTCCVSSSHFLFSECSSLPFLMHPLHAIPLGRFFSIYPFFSSVIRNPWVNLDADLVPYCTFGWKPLLYYPYFPYLHLLRVVGCSTTNPFPLTIWR